MVTPKYPETFDPKEKTITYIDEHTKTKSDAYASANEWIAKNFRSAKDVIQMQDKDAGIIIVKAIYTYQYIYNPTLKSSVPVDVNYSMAVYVKDGKIKTEFDTGYISGSGNYYPPKEELPALSNIIRRFTMILLPR